MHPSVEFLRISIHFGFSNVEKTNSLQRKSTQITNQLVLRLLCALIKIEEMPSRAGIFQNKYQMAQPGLALNPDGDGECMGGDLVCVGSPFHCYFWCGVENILIFHFLLNLSIAFGLSSQHRTGSSKHQSLALALPDRNGQNLPAKTKKLLQNMGLSSFHLLSALQVFEDYTWKL